MLSASGVGTVAVQQGSVQLTGARVGNYRLIWNNSDATITRKVLTVTANDDARFVGLSDTAGYNGVSYSGFANGESTAQLTTLATVTRNNASVGTAATYPNVLVPDGAAAANYSFNYVNGSYTIVPADRLLVKLQSVSTEYASAASYTLLEAKYMLSNSSVVNLMTPGVGSASITNSGTVNVTDISGASASFTVAVGSGSYSTSGTLEVGT